MKRLTLLIITFVVALAAPACAAPPAQVTGDAWDYRLKLEELGLPGNWTLGQTDVLTAYDLQSGEVVTPTASLANAQQVYTVQYQPPATSQFGDYTLEIIIYPTAADATSALTAGTPQKDWQRVDSAPTVGEESRVWRFVSPDPSIQQGLFRVDFRHLNVIASVTMLGSSQVLPDANEPLNQARKVLDKIKTGAAPPELAKLRSAQAPDLRTVLLTPKQLAELTAKGEDGWSVNPVLLPGWTNNEDFSTEARGLLDQLGRVTGYQMWLIKPPVAEAKTLDPGAGLFQQVSVYQRAESTANGLKAMVGLQGAKERPEPPHVGEAARAWNALVPYKLPDGEQAVIAATEISFRVGPYVASIQLQSQPVTDPRSTAILKENYDLAVKLAQALEQNLRAAKP
jgi:hypothetical protein